MAAPVFGGTANMDFAYPSRGVPTHAFTYSFMTNPPLAGDIVFGFVQQVGVNNPSLTVSAGWTVDDQHASADGSWIVFHRAILADGETGPTVSGIVTSGATFYAGFIWIYRNFHGFDGGPVLDYSWTPVIDLVSPAITTALADSLIVLAWLVPFDGTFNSDDRVEIRSGTNGSPDWFERFPGIGSGAPLRIYDSGLNPTPADTYGPVGARRRDIFNPTVDLASPYLSLAWGLKNAPSARRLGCRPGPDGAQLMAHRSPVGGGYSQTRA